jgi:hypothetical protein
MEVAKCCVFFAVRTESLNIIQTSFDFEYIVQLSLILMSSLFYPYQKTSEPAWEPSDTKMRFLSAPFPPP